MFNIAPSNRLEHIEVSSAVTFAARQIVAGAVLLLFMLLGASQADADAGHLLDRLTPEVMAIVWPGAEKLGPEEGKPAAIAVYRNGKIAGYIFSTLDIVHAPGFSGVPFDVIAGVDLTGHISGAKAVITTADGEWLSSQADRSFAAI